MNRESLVKKVNDALDTPLIFFCREAERAIGLEKLLKNYHIACVEDSPLVDELLNQHIPVFCLERVIKQQQQPVLVHRSTLELVGHHLTHEWLQQISAQKFYALVFKPVKALEFKLQQLGGTLLQSTLESGTQFENKLFQIELFKTADIPTPQSSVHVLGDQTFQELQSVYGSLFVVQLEKGHTGTGTFFIESETDFLNLKKTYAGNAVRIAEYIKGAPFTINACITDSICIGSPQYQITGLKKLNGNAGTTMGNDFAYGATLLTTSVQMAIQQILTVLGNNMRAAGYTGLFGIDLIIKDDVVYVIEINARQTANIPLETKLCIKQSSDAIPLQLVHIAYFLQVLPTDYKHNDFMPLHGSQLFLRAPEDNIVLQDECKNGIYRLQSDNAAFDFATNDEKPFVIYIDEMKDKPLIWQHSGYAVDDLTDGGFVLLTGRTGSVRNASEEIARLQFNQQIVHNGSVTPWTVEALQTIQSLITTMGQTDAVRV